MTRPQPRRRRLWFLLALTLGGFTNNLTLVLGEEEAAAPEAAVEEAEAEPAEEFAAQQVLVRLYDDEDPVPFEHPGGPLTQDALRAFCQAQLKKHMTKNGIDPDGKDGLFSLMEGLWITCRTMLSEKLPEAMRGTPPVVNDEL